MAPEHSPEYPPEHRGEDLPDSARALLDAVIAISSDLDLHSVLTRIIESATELTGAQYGALGIIGSDGTLSDFITTGIDSHTRAEIGDLPRGQGILGLLIDEPETIRLDSIQAHPKSYGFPAHHPTMTTFLGVPIRIRGTVFGNLYLTEKAGKARFSEQDEALVQALASAAGYVIDNARAYGLSERRRQWLEASAELADALQPPIALQRALQQITNGARAVSGAVATAVVQLPHDGPAVVEAVDGPAASEVPRLLEPLAGAISEAANRPDPVELAAGGFKALVIPLRARLAGRGVLIALFEKEHRVHEFDEHELLASFADQAALAVDRAQAVVDREELALISDRDRIARDLHDVVIQRLFASGLQLQSIRAIAVSPEVAARIDQTVDDLDQTIKDIRGTIFELQNQQSDSLRAEIQGLVREYAPVLGFTPTTRLLGPLETVIGTELRGELVPVLREALSNISRHALADHAEIEVRATEVEVVLSVLDDGVGAPTQRTESGLRNARRRADKLGGSFELTSIEPRGTAFTWRVPLD